MRKKRLPAFGRAVMLARRAGLAPFGWLCIVRRWPKLPPHPDSTGWTIVVPAMEDPQLYDLSLCRGLPVFVVADSNDNSNAVLVSLVEAAKPLIGCALVDGEFSTWIGGDNGR